MDPSFASAAQAPQQQDEHLTMIVSAVLQEYYDNNGSNLSLLRDSIKIVAKLTQNAVEKADAKFRRVKLSNARIQAAVMAVPGALDVLGLAGFVKQGNEALEWMDSPSNRDCANLVRQQLESKLQELDQVLGPSTAATTPVKVSAPSPAAAKSSSTEENVFLSEEERLRRREAAKAARKAKAAERTIALQRWKEDEEDRKIKTRAAPADFASDNVVDTEENMARAKLLMPQIRIQKLQQKPAPPEPKQEENTAAASAESEASMVPEPVPVSASAEAPSVAELKAPPAAAATTAAAAVPMETEEAGAAPAEPSEADKAWQAHLNMIPRCAAASRIRNTSYFQRHHSKQSGTNKSCLKHLMKELDSLETGLPSDARSSIVVRFDEETPQFLRAVVAAALPGPTPYAGGLFCFDIYIPHAYPQVPPQVQLLTTGQGTVRFGPNLYADGKVCLSLLGTWNGPKWIPGRSTLLQVLVSIQGLILGTEHPYYLEPGHGGWEGNVKQGDFALTGHTLGTGEVVTEDCVPLNVAIYENTVRVGTLRWAMLDMVKAVRQVADKKLKRQAAAAAADDSLEASLKEASESILSLTYLKPLIRPIWVHFFHNREAILKEVKSWARDNHIKGKSQRGWEEHDDDDDDGEQDDGFNTMMSGMHMHSGNDESRQQKGHQSLLKKIQALRQQLEAALVDLPEPPASPEEEDDEDDEDESMVDAAALTPPHPKKMKASTSLNLKPPPAAAESSTKPPPTLDDLKSQMQEAATVGNFILAGKLQASVQACEELQNKMQEAAKEGDFIRAGSFQEQLNAHLAAAIPTSAPAAAAEEVDEDLGEEEEELGYAEEAMEEDDGFSDGEDDGYGDDGYDDGYGGASSSWAPHNWGAGTQLKAAVSSSSSKPAKKPAPAPAAQKHEPYQSKRSSGTTCRLRIRLPEGQVNTMSITEQFDGQDTLADVYGHLEQFVKEPEASSTSSAVARKARSTKVRTEYGMHTVQEPTFANPLSIKGFTLLLARPKREFSLEMHGTVTLTELGLVPSATLTVLLCQDRGVVRRGDLESRLKEAQGDAMDVEGLSYEGLLELTERVGATGKEWTPESQAKLESKSTLISPAAYLEELANQKAGATGVDAAACRCPICLGEFDKTDETKCLRRLHVCQHVFHVACLGTWLQTKSACPMCNQEIA